MLPRRKLRFGRVSDLDRGQLISCCGRCDSRSGARESGDSAVGHAGWVGEVLAGEGHLVWAGVTAGGRGDLGGGVTVRGEAPRGLAWGCLATTAQNPQRPGDPLLLGQVSRPPPPAPWSGQLVRPRAADVTHASPRPGRAVLARDEGRLRVQKAACLCVCVCQCACVRVSTCARRCVFLSLRPLLSWGKCNMVTRAQSVLEGLEAEPGEGLCHTWPLRPAPPLLQKTQSGFSLSWSPGTLCTRRKEEEVYCKAFPGALVCCQIL